MFVLTEKVPVYKFCITHRGDWLIKSSISGIASFSQILAKARAVLVLFYVGVDFSGIQTTKRPEKSNVTWWNEVMDATQTTQLKQERTW